MTSQVSVATFSSVAAEYCALNFNPGVAKNVTPAPEITVWIAEVCTTIIDDPTGKATEALVGTVRALVDAPAI